MSKLQFWYTTPQALILTLSNNLEYAIVYFKKANQINILGGLSFSLFTGCIMPRLESFQNA
jgi:hypothetical protein